MIVIHKLQKCFKIKRISFREQIERIFYARRLKGLQSSWFLFFNRLTIPEVSINCSHNSYSVTKSVPDIYIVLHVQDGDKWISTNEAEGSPISSERPINPH
jgi:hypothetical protein